MKYLSTLLLATFCLCFASCKQVEMPFTHEDSEVVITAMEMWNMGFNVISPGENDPFPTKEHVEAEIVNHQPDEVGEIVFRVPRDKRNLYDLHGVYIKATVDFDLYISPKLSGRYDLTLDDNDEPRLELTVKSARTGFEKRYKVYAMVSYN